MFCNDVIQQIDYLSSDDFAIGIVPFPKLDSSQDDYVVPITHLQPTVICIPRVTQNREISEFFVDVLSSTGREYTVQAYYDDIRSKFDMNTADEDMEILIDCVFDKITYDAGLTNSWYPLCATIKTAIVEGTGYNQALSEDIENIMEIIQAWNDNWQYYYDD